MHNTELDGFENDVWIRISNSIDNSIDQSLLFTEKAKDIPQQIGCYEYNEKTTNQIFVFRCELLHVENVQFFTSAYTCDRICVVSVHTIGKVIVILSKAFEILIVIKSTMDTQSEMCLPYSFQLNPTNFWCRFIAYITLCLLAYPKIDSMIRILFWCWLWTHPSKSKYGGFICGYIFIYRPWILIWPQSQHIFPFQKV